MTTSSRVPTQLCALALTLALASAAACGDADEPSADLGDGGDQDAGDVSEEVGDVGPDAAPDAADLAADAEDGGDGEDEPDAGEYAGRFTEARGLPIDERLDLEGLRYPVHVVVDELGIPHILAESAEDAIFVQGWLHARDRWAQMELFRRSTGGTLGRVAGAVSEPVLEDDIFFRLLGFQRLAREMYEAMDEASFERRGLDAYAAGVNAQIAAYRSGEAQIPWPFRPFLPASFYEDWQPWDGLTIVRFQQYDLGGRDGFSEIARTEARALAAEVFAADSEDPALAARAGLLADLQRFAPIDPTFQVPGFGVSRLSTPKRGGAAESSSWRAPNLRALRTALGHAQRPLNALAPRFANPRGMSNSWAVSGAHTTHGHPVLANDPHLGLESPTVFYQAHIVVEPRTEADGPALDVYGVMFPGLPGALIGHNQHVAWGMTTASYDYVDAFEEQLVWVDGEDWPRVVHDGVEVELELYEETFEVGGGGNPLTTFTRTLPWVPNRGPLLVEIDGRDVTLPREDTAISLQWRAFEPSNEVAAINGWMQATTVEEARAAAEAHWAVGTQNLLFADVDGDILTTGQSYIPQRPAAAMTWDPETNPEGYAPFWVLSGTGEHDWLEEPLPNASVPHALNPEVGFIVTANNDQVGVTADNDPLNDYAYIGYDYALGFRAGRITRLLEAAIEAGPMTTEAIAAIQEDHYSNMGEAFVPLLLSFLSDLLEEYETEGSHPELTAIADAFADGATTAEVFYDLLSAWTLEAEDGLWGEPTEADRDAARATSAFNYWLTAIVQGAFFDELAAAPGLGVGDSEMIRALHFLLTDPEAAVTYDETTGESALWDDLGTTEVVESSAYVLALGLFTANEELTEAFGTSDPDAWLCGQVHYRRFDHQIPDISDFAEGESSLYDWPQPDEGNGVGYPRPGDNHNVDACHGGTTNYNYRCGGGAVLRFVVELDPEGVRSWNAIPGGQVHDHDSPHFRDLLDEYWLDWQRFEVPFHPAQVAGAAETHLVLGRR
jgi:penicillin amidase